MNSLPGLIRMGGRVNCECANLFVRMGSLRLLFGKDTLVTNSCPEYSQKLTAPTFLIESLSLFGF